MTKVSILSEPMEGGRQGFRAVAGSRQSIGRTAGEALDALSEQLPLEDSGTMVVLQNFRADGFFAASQQERLETLMNKWRAARDSGASLPSEEQIELEGLVNLEMKAASDRAAEMLRVMGE